MTTLLEHLVSGGPVMIPIGIASILGSATFVERLVSLRRGAVVPRKLVDDVLGATRSGRIDEAQALCKHRDAAVARVFAVGLEHAAEERSVIKERMEEVGKREAMDLERFLPILATVGALGPLLGLLGTVGGMILTFEVVQASGQPTVQDLARGIAQALIATFSGLIVAIPAVASHRFFVARVDGLVTELEEASIALLDAIATGRKH